MPYKKKLTLLSAITAALFLTYMLTLIFDPEQIGKRSDSYSWLEPSQVPLVSVISILRPGEGPEGSTVLTRINGKWFVTRDGKDYPARDARVEDFIAMLAKKAPYPVSSSSASSHGRLSLTEETAGRVTLTGAAGPPILDLLIGAADATGQNAYMRKRGQDEARSGENKFSAYIDSPPSSWYNLRLFPDSESGALDAASVQRLAVYAGAPSEGGGGDAPLVFTRRGKAWEFNFEVPQPDTGKADSYVRDVLNAQGNDFSDSVDASHPMFGYRRIDIEFGDGTIRAARFSRPDEEDGSCYATVTGSNLVYSVPGWTAEKLFPGAPAFSGE